MLSGTQTTRLGLHGGSRPAYAGFVDKAALPSHGVLVQAREVFTAGAMARSAFTAGMQSSEVHTAGAVKREVSG